ncbi:hypothetical protein FRC11_015090, partial [Ceratobasidium sp. 423]
AQPVTYNEDHDPNTDTYQGKARGRGGRGTRGGRGGRGGHVRGRGGGQVGTDDAGNGAEVEVEVEYMEGIRGPKVGKKILQSTLIAHDKKSNPFAKLLDDVKQLLRADSFFSTTSQFSSD